MKIGLTADLHLRDGKEHPERHNALADVLAKLRADNISELVIAGDLFDENIRNYSQFEKLCDQNSNIRIHIITGNHDSDLRPSDIASDNVYVYNEPQIVQFNDTYFLMLPYRNVQPGEVIAGFREQLEPGKPVLVSHCDYGSGSRQENPHEPGVYMPMSKKDFAGLNLSDVFLGHIHKPMKAGIVRYIGSPVGMDITETGKRYFLIYDTTNKTVNQVQVDTDVLFFNETFLVIPEDNETDRLTKNIESRIKSWDIPEKDYGKVQLRVAVTGYATDRNAIVETTAKAFEGFRFYNDKKPDFERLNISRDPQLAGIAKRSRELIESMERVSGSDDPETGEIVEKAMEVIYGEA